MSAVIADPGADVAPIPAARKSSSSSRQRALALVLVLGGGAVVWLKQRAAHAAAAAIHDEAAAEHASTPRIDPKNAPIYLPLDPFVVNLADKDSDRYAQIGITLELDNGFSADQIKAYMPAIRNAVLMVLANKSSRDLMNREGKEQLAQEIMREAVRPMGIETASPEPITAAPVEVGASAVMAVADAASAKPKAGAKRRLDAQRNPIQHVHFSSFIIQ
jgi:flagellar FliL protein